MLPQSFERHSRIRFARTSRLYPVAVSIFLLAFPGAIVARVYRIIELGSLGGSYCIPEAINNKGQVVGQSYIDAGISTHVFSWQNGVMTDLGTLGGTSGTAWDINDSGVIVGNATDASEVERAFIATAGGGLTNLSQLSYAGHITNAGAIAGTTADGSSPAILEGGNLTVIPIAGGAYSINDSGWVVGNQLISVSTPPYTLYHGFLYKNGQVTDLGNLMGLYDSHAHDINDSGLIVGSAYILAGSLLFEHAVDWRDGVIKDLYAFSGPQNNYAYKVNNRGDIVGTSYNNQGGFAYFPFYRLAGGKGSLTVVADSTGWRLVGLNDINDSGQMVGGGMLNGQLHGILLDPVKIRLKLTDARNLPASHDTVNVYKVSNDRPEYTMSLIGTFVSDSAGIITLPEDSVDVGTKFKVEMTLARSIYTKHTAVLETMARHFLDNIRFDTLGAVSFDTISGDSVQPVRMDHSTMAYNLVVSIQWDADPTYVALTQTGFRKFSNYLYDVSDGQIRLDTVDIFTNSGLWSEADIRVWASNQVWPKANVFGINVLGGFLNLPPRWYGNLDAARNGSFAENPLNPSLAFDYRTRCHEFGHYALGFFDEYRFADSAGVVRSDTGRCADPASTNYGYMDHQYVTSPAPYNSELSTADRYASSACRNNDQYRLRGMSCWDFLKSWAEYYDVERGVQVPIWRPSDRPLAAGLDYLPGPDDDPDHPADFDVGSLVQFPIIHNSAVAISLPVAISDSATGVGIKKSSVFLRRNAGATIMDEGQTDDFGQIRLLGYLPTDTVLCSGKISVVPGAALATANGERWFSRVAVPGGVTSFILNASPIAGDFPLVCAAAIDSGQIRYHLSADRLFGSAPNLDLLTSLGQHDSASFVSGASGYDAVLSDSASPEGYFTLHAVDDSGQAFFVQTPYTFGVVDSQSSHAFVAGPEGTSELLVHVPDADTQRVLLMSSPYPVVRTGVDPSALQGGDAISVAIAPANPGTLSLQLTIRYSEGDLYSATGDPLEQYLKIYHWDEIAAQWKLIGGEVDTSANEVSSPIDAQGVYAAFTSGSPTGVDDRGQGSRLPQQFDLWQNFPNPFNPTTTIRYHVPAKSRVRLEIFNILGRSVRTLVDDVEPAGVHQATWDGTDLAGDPVASGIYFYRLTTDHFTASKKMLLLK